MPKRRSAEASGENSTPTRESPRQAGHEFLQIAGNPTWYVNVLHVEMVPSMPTKPRRAFAMRLDGCDFVQASWGDPLLCLLGAAPELRVLADSSH